MTEIGSVNQVFKALQKEITTIDSSKNKTNLSPDFSEVFSRVIAKNIAQAVIDKEKISAGELRNCSMISLSPKSKNISEIEEEVFEELVKKVKKLAVEWIRKRKEGNKR